MADEQDVFISGISGSIASWSTEATASRIAGTLKQISAQNASIIQLLNAVKGGGSLSSKELKKVGDELRQNGAKVTRGQKQEQAQNTQTQGVLSRHLKGIQSMVMGQDRLSDQIVKNAREERKEAVQLKQLMQAGLSKEEATATLEGEKQERGYEKMLAGLSAGLGMIAAVQEATKVGFEQRFDFAEELRTSGLLGGINSVNDGFISVAKTVSDTGFTFGMAAEFTKDFAKTVGVKGVKSTLDFVNSMARGPGGLMEEYAIEFGQVVGMSGDYLDMLRVSGQLRGRSDEELKNGMQDFMTNVVSVANVLKISMEEAATLLKNSLTDVQKGLLATQPKAIQDAVRLAMSSANVMDNPLTDLLGMRLAAGSEQAFMLTDAYQEAMQTALGMANVGFVNQAGSQFDRRGQSGLDNFLANEFRPYVDSQVETFAQPGARGLLVSQEGMAATLGRMVEATQTVEELTQGMAGKNLVEDQAVVQFRDSQLRAVNLAETSMNEVMPGFVRNMELLTETNRKFAEQAADTITANGNLIDTVNNVGTSVDRTLSWFGRQMLKVAEVSGSILSLGNADNDIITARDFTTNISGANTISKDEANDFKTMSNSLVRTLNKKGADYSEEQLLAQKAEFKNVVDTLLKTTAATGDDKANLNSSLLESQAKVMAKLDSLLKALGEN
tara:strand:+ start:267 stop:2279 length:2013 start_codon:yes stop_codon:yes gene_type:complete